MLQALSARPADRPTQVLLVGMKPTVQNQIHEASHRESDPILLSLTSDKATGLHGRTNVESSHREYNLREDASKFRYEQEVCNKRKMMPTKPDTSSDEKGMAGDDKRRKAKTRRKNE